MKYKHDGTCLGHIGLTSFLSLVMPPEVVMNNTFLGCNIWASWAVALHTSSPNI